MTDEGFATVHRRVIEQYIGFFIQMLTELIHTRHYGCRVDGPVDQVRPQRIVALQKS